MIVPEATVRHYDGINNTPAVGLIVHGLSELMDNGWAPDEVNASYENSAFVAFQGDKPVGVLAYNKQEWRKVLWVQMAYVLPSARNEGIYARLWHEAVAKAVELKMVKVQGGVHVGNTVMRRTAVALGRKESFVTYDFDVPQQKEEESQDDVTKKDEYDYARLSSAAAGVGERDGLGLQRASELVAERTGQRVLPRGPESQPAGHCHGEFGKQFIDERSELHAGSGPAAGADVQELGRERDHGTEQVVQLEHHGSESVYRIKRDRPEPEHVEQHYYFKDGTHVVVEHDGSVRLVGRDGTKQKPSDGRSRKQ